MKASGIGGQAVMEGVMMKNKDKYAVAVRKPDKEIVVDIQDFKSATEKYKILGKPVLRGVVTFIESLVVGVKTLTYSASFFEEDETPKKEKSKAKENLAMAGTVCLSIVLAIGIFMMLPYFLSGLLSSVIEQSWLLALLEGVIRILLFVGYVAAISLMKDIKRVFMYHGAEHKSINCIENGYELNVQNVRKQSREHKRCGTSFLLYVMLISVIFFMFIRVENSWLRILFRLLLIPVIAGVSYEFIRLAGRSESKFIAALSKPGLLLQKMTTAEPDDDMIEVAIASVEAVFDWQGFISTDKQKESKADSKKNTRESNKENNKKNSKRSDNKDQTQENEADKPEKIASVEDKKTVKEEPAAEDKKTAKEEPAAEEKKAAKKEPAVKEKKAPTAPETAASDDEDDDILKALDQYFVLKQKKDSDK